MRTLAGLHEVLADLHLGRLQAAVSRLGHASSSPGSRFSIQVLLVFPWFYQLTRASVRSPLLVPPHLLLVARSPMTLSPTSRVSLLRGFTW